MTCVEWKEEIRQQIAQGMSEEEIIDAFVARFGEHVVGAPQDPTLRAISLITPWVAAALAIIIGVWTFIRWRRNHSLDSEFAAVSASTGDTEMDDYRARLEEDLMERR